MSGGPAPPGTGPLFLGRRDELAELRAGLDDIASSRGRAFLLAGEGGIGKSRLLDALVAEVEPTEVRAVVGRCWQPRAAPPLWPWVQVLRACTAELADDALERHLGPGAADVAVLVPELGQRLPGLDPVQPSPSPDARLRLFESVTAFLGNVAGDGGLVVALDDLHAADEASLRLVQHVAEGVGRSTILLVGTYRDAHVRSIPHLHRVIAAIARHGRRLVLAGLDEHDVATLLEHAMAEQVEPTVAREVHLATDGNPLFVLEVGRLLRMAPGASLPVPEDVHDVIRRRLDALSPPVREVLGVAAVVERPFDLPLLGAVSDLDVDALRPLLHEALALEVIVEVAPGRWWFSHELVQETLYDEIRFSRRVALHRRVGELLEPRVKREPPGEVGELAHHFFEAARAGDGVKAREYCSLAGDAAMATLAFEEAAIRYGRALEALAVTPPVDERERHRLLLCLGRAHVRLGDLVQARECQRRALKSARAVGSAELLAAAAVGFLDEPGWPVDETQASVVAEARAALPDEDGPLLARVLLALGTTARNRGTAVGMADEGLAMARRLGHRDTLHACLAARLDVDSELDVPDRRLALADELIGVAEETGDLELLQRARQRRARERLAAGDVGGAATDLELAAQDAERLRLPSLIRSATAWRAGLAVLQGRLDEAARLACRSGAPGVDDDVLFPLYALRREQGLGEDMADVARRWVGDSPDRVPPLARAMLALALAELGKCQEARHEIEGVVDELLHGPASRGPAGAAVVADVSWIIGEAEWAGAAYECLLRWPERHLLVGAGCSLGASSRYLGQLATLLGRPEEAEAHFEAAHRVHERLGAPGWLAHGRVDHARMLLARNAAGDAARARDLAAAAQKSYRALGMAAHERRAGALVDEPGPPAASAGPEHGVFTLEGEYWAIHYGGAEARLRDSKGLRYLARLLQAPGQEVHALDLVVGEGGRGAASLGAARQSGLGTTVNGDAGAVLDARAKAAYKRRLTELRADVEEAAAYNDLGRLERAQSEMDFLVAELAAGVGLGGRDRRAASDAERARQSVTRAIKGAVDRIAAAHPALGEHLRTTVRTGIYSCYAPDPRVPIRWESP
ncbi:MAG TPA: AAA family ATPase [Acidimicrobiales bacterium]|nr:AAA family ATPase [Acidimicrobiales bacterium]